MDNAMISIDASNLFKGERKHNWKIDYQKLITYYKNKYSITQSIYYDGYPTYSLEKHRTPNLTDKEFKFKKRKVNAKFNLISSFGWSIIKKPVTFVTVLSTLRIKPKCNFDVEIAIDALDHINNYDVFILGSGDGDFTPLIEYLKSKGKTVIVLSWRDRLSSILRESTPNIVTIGQLRNEIELL